MNDFSFVVRYDEEASVVKELDVKEALGESKEGSGSYIYDMGENVIGVPHITIPADYVDPGSTVTVRYAEILYPAPSGVSGRRTCRNHDGRKPSCGSLYRFLYRR